MTVGETKKILEDIFDGTNEAGRVAALADKNKRRTDDKGRQDG